MYDGTGAELEIKGSVEAAFRPNRLEQWKCRKGPSGDPPPKYSQALTHQGATYTGAQFPKKGKFPTASRSPFKNSPHPLRKLPLSCPAHRPLAGAFNKLVSFVLPQGVNSFTAQAIAPCWRPPSDRTDTTIRHHRMSFSRWKKKIASKVPISVQISKLKYRVVSYQSFLSTVFSVKMIQRNRGKRI